MYRDKETTYEKQKRWIENFDHLAKILQSSKAMQTRFKLIPESALNNVTRAGIRDMKLGRVKDGKPVGANIIRVNNPSPGTRSDFPRICIDPLGKSDKANPHIKISPDTVKAAENIQKGLKVGGKVLFVMSIVTGGIRIGKAIYDEINIDSEIEALENIIDCLEEDLRNSSKQNKREIEKAKKFAESLLEDARDCKRNPGKKTVLSTLCIGAEWAGAAGMGFAGAQTGALIGSPGGPIGAVVGAVSGSVIGAVVGSEMGQSAVQNFRCNEDGIATEIQGSLVNFGDQRKHQVLGVDGNIYAGKGIEVGARGSVFQMKEDENSFTLGKAGANFGITDKGADVGVEGKLVWTEVQADDLKLGVGLNVDTGIKVDDNNVELSVLGFGFSGGKDGFGVKLPFLSLKWS